jgi:phenylpropionate dioxygenase-like ring-hydroxylating dioxygenase large terminal subunit
MDQPTQAELVARVLSLLPERGTDTGQAEGKLVPGDYTDPARLEREIERLFSPLPLLVAHASELPGPGAFLTHDTTGVPLLVSRDREGRARAFLNVCRHRGTRVVMAEKGHAKAFVCPYHGWSYDDRGALLHVPHRQGFPTLVDEQAGLVELPAEETSGFVWVTPRPRPSSPRASDFVAPLSSDLAALGVASHVSHRPAATVKSLNWKIAIEIFLEAYHVKYAHKASIYPLFFDNVALFDRFAPHSRSVFPKRTIAELAGTPRETWDLRRHANVLFFVFPNVLMLVQADHVSMVSVFPQGTDRTLLRTSTLLPKEPETDRERTYWGKNVDILMNAVSEDLALGESIQAGLRSGANQAMKLATFEHSLGWFHDSIATYLAA